MSGVLSPDDDGVHPDASPFYLEWWYFDVLLPDDSALAFVFHLTDLLRPASKSGSLSTMVFHPGRQPYAQFTRFARREIAASSFRCDIGMGANRCWLDDAGVYHVSVNDGVVEAEIAFESLTAGWKPGSGRIEFGRRGRFFAWVVPQPLAQARGFVRVGGVRREIDGIGYHDHNWGTVSLIDALSAWSWGRIYADDWVVVYADMHLASRYTPSRARPFLAAHVSGRTISSFLHQCRPLDDRTDFVRMPDRVERPMGWGLAWKGEADSLDLRLTTTHVLERTDLIQGQHPWIRWMVDRLVAHPYYLRCVAAVEGTLTWGGQVEQVSGGRAICEQMVLRAPG